jgi:creatinine amidohydrolase
MTQEVRAMRRKVRWEEMFPDELDAALAECPVAYLTFGMCEPHGLHAAVGLDTLKAHGVACAAAEVHGGVVAPAFHWHVHEMGIDAAWSESTIGDRNPWLTALPPWVLYKVFWYQLRTVSARGFHAAIVITGHMPYERDFARVAEVFQRHDPLRIWVGSDGMASDLGDLYDGHAGRSETSLLWALYPELVDMSRLAQGPDEEVERTMATGLGARDSSRRFGEQLVRGNVDWLGGKTRELLDAYVAPATPRAPMAGNPLGAMTLDEAEGIWREEVEPLLTTFVSMDSDHEYGEVPEGSVWAPNARSRFYAPAGGD